MENEYENARLEHWVMAKVDDWRNHYDTNYRDSFEEYYRLWRGIWAKQDSMRQTERSRIITPALQQAVESSVAEVEEATFSRGKWFDIEDDFQDQDGGQDVEFTKRQLYEDMKFAKARSCISEVLINAAVFGTGIGEVYLEEVKELVPASEPVMDGTMTAVGVRERERFLVKLRPIMPQNFAIDPLATSVDEALGCAVDMYVPLHQVEMDIERGIYRNVEVTTVESDSELEPDNDLTFGQADRVRLTRYYGLVPRYLFDEATTSEEAAETEELEALLEEPSEADKSYVEAIIVIANGDTLLKVERNPFMMQDRPIVAFQWDTVPSKFWGRGVCEKGYNPQKALDTELRARIDALALTVHPMMAVDASRMPRGAKYEIRPGKTLLTNGNPAEILQPFNFGNVDQITFAQGQTLQQMVQQATGAVDTLGMQNAMEGEAAVGTVSMSLGAIIKRHKRTLLNFQENFLIPFVTKSAHRYMQFDPELYSAQDYKFVATSTLGMIAREYEVTQLVQLLQTMPQDSPMYPLLVQSIVESMNLTNREEILDRIRQSQEPDPEQQEIAMQTQQLQMATMQAQLELIQQQTAEVASRVVKNEVETELMPVEQETKRISAVNRNRQVEEDEKELNARVKIAELSLKERDIQIKEENSRTQRQLANQNANR